MEFGLYGAALLADQETQQNDAATKAGHATTAAITGVNCDGPTTCTQVAYTRDIDVTQAELTPANHIGLNQEQAVLVYDPATMLTRYYREDVNGKTVHEFKLLSLT